MNRKTILTTTICILLNFFSPAYSVQEEDPILSTDSFKPKMVEEQLMYSTVRIQTDIGIGTGFIFNFKFDMPNKEVLEVPCIITNKHVVKGAKNGKLALHGGRGETYTPMLGSEPNGQAVIVEFLSDKWIEHPESGVDLCAVPIRPLLKSLNISSRLYLRAVHEDMIPNVNDLKGMSIMEDIFTMGYPAGNWDSIHNFPIFRKGTTASHPRINFNEKPEFVIDAACFPGTSGSPVFIKKRDKHFFGGIIYSGPLMEIYNDNQLTNNKKAEIPINLGHVIKSEKLKEFKEIINNKIKNHNNTEEPIDMEID